MNRLRDLREDKDLLQKDIAKVLNMSQTGYSQYETETNDIPTEILKKLAYLGLFLKKQLILSAIKGII